MESTATTGFADVKQDVLPIETKSMCPQCEDENGLTKLLLVVVPYFRELILASFECSNEECGYHNSSVQFGGACLPKGSIFSLKIQSLLDLNRQLVKSEYCTVCIPDVELEIPPKGEGEITTVEGLIVTAIENLQQAQQNRQEEYPELAKQLQTFVESKLKPCLEVKNEFTLQLNDPSGNSFIANINPPHPDPQLTVTYYCRSVEDDVRLGLAPSENENSKDKASEKLHDSTAASDQCSDSVSSRQDGDTLAPAKDYNTRRSQLEEQKLEDGELLSLGYELEEQCFACKQKGKIKMVMIDIPHFKETVIMSFKCDFCGFGSNEVKCGGAIPSHGTRIKLCLLRSEDLSRDILKSHNCNVRIPEIDFEMSEGSLGAMFTTVEGLLSQMYDQLLNVHNTGFGLGDSSTAVEHDEFSRVLRKLDDMRSGKQFPFTLILRDPLSHSYLQSFAEDNGSDPQLEIERYERTEEENADLGIDFLLEQEKRDEEQQRHCQQQQL